MNVSFSFCSHYLVCLYFKIIAAEEENKATAGQVSVCPVRSSKRPTYPSLIQIQPIPFPFGQNFGL